MELVQIIGSRDGCLIDVKALVLPVVLVEAVLHAGVLHELPGAGRARAGLGHRIVAALDDGEIGKLFGQALGAEDLSGVGEVLFAALGEDLHGLAPVAQEVLVLFGHGWLGGVGNLLGNGALPGVEGGLFGGA